MKRTSMIKTGLWTLGALIFLSALSFAERNVAANQVSDIEVIIRQTEQGNFISEIDVEDRLNDFYPPSLHGENIKGLNLNELDSLVESSPFVKQAKVYSNLEGKLYVDINQEIPLLRIINNKGKSYYISTEGKKLPLSAHRTTRVPVATGFINEEVYPIDSLQSTQLKDLYSIAKKLEERPFFKALTGQLYVNKTNDILLITKAEERHDIILGNAENIDTKLDNLYQFYTKVLPIKGWDYYSTINLKFKDQIVAKK